MLGPMLGPTVLLMMMMMMMMMMMIVLPFAAARDIAAGPSPGGTLLPLIL